MFTGIVRGIGTVRATEKTADGLRLWIEPGQWDGGEYIPNLGDSIANNGCCLTLVEIDDGAWVFDAIPETLMKTTLATWTLGQRINNERSLRMGDGLDGHQVQGHVDGVGTVLQVNQSDGYRIRIGLAEMNMHWMIPKGSVTVDGVSLTIAAVDHDEQWIEVALIPETLGRTNLGDRTAADGVNIEADVMVKTIVATMERMQGVL